MCYVLLLICLVYDIICYVYEYYPLWNYIEDIYLLNLAEDTFVTLAKSKNERIKLQAVLHLSETLGKKFYSKREEHKVIEEGEGEELEPENKERLDKLLKIAIVEKPLQDKAQIENKESAPL